MKKIIFNLTGICCLFLISCNDLEQHPLDRFTDVNFWTSEAKASAVLNQAYCIMGRYPSSTSQIPQYYPIIFDMERLTDNIYFAKGTDPSMVVVGAADAYNQLFSIHWRDCYQGIKACHVFLSNIDRVPMDANKKERMKAEARFLRAYQFFRLTTNFGDIPFFDYEIPLEESLVIGRTPHAEVVNWVRSELNSIVSILPTKQQYAAADNGRITKGAVMGLLAQTYLHANDWANVSATCKKIMDGEYGTYNLLPDYEGVFLPQNQYSTEILLDIAYVDGVRTWDAMRDNIPISQLGRSSEFAPTQDLVEDYIMLNGLPIKDPNSGYNEDNPYVNRDPRMNAIVYHGYKWKKPDGTFVTIEIDPLTSTTVDKYVPNNLFSSPTGYYLRKWYDPTARQSDMASGLNIILIRYADILLMYAEAMIEQNQMNEQVWNATIKKLRERAGFTDPNALDWKASYNQAALREIVRRERRCELAFEGTRLYDLRRWKTAEIVLNGRPRGAKFANNNTEYILATPRTFNKNRDYLWPVPGSERDINPNLGQNPGW